MSTGKLASQAGHAFLDSYFQALQSRPMIATEYDGTKVVLVARDLEHLERAYEMAQLYGLPSALVIDSGHISLPFFTGTPIITAVGLGPCTRAEVQCITKHYQLLK